MSCWRSCSSRAAAAAALACALLASACAGPGKAISRVRGPIAVLPPVNLSGVAAPLREVRAALEAALRAERVEIVDPAALEAFLVKHRMRYTGGVDRAAAVDAAAELGASALLVSSVDLFQAEAPPKLGLTLRLVSATDDPAILWIDGDSRSGDQSPGLFDLGIVSRVDELVGDLTRDLARSLAAWSGGRGPRARGCEASSRHEPGASFRSHLFRPDAKYTIAVLPFVNETGRRGAGELLALQFVRQLEAAGRYRVVEPGVVRDELLRYRIVMESGLSLDNARVISELLRADLVVTGTVRDHLDGAAAVVDFSAMVLDRKNDELLWQSTSHARGDDGVFFFDCGRIATAGALSCRMVSSVVLALGRWPVSPPTSQELRRAEAARKAAEPKRSTARAR